MLIGEGQAIARAWLRDHELDAPPVVGAFFAGSTIDADPAAELDAASDVDLVVVVAGDAPPKLGKFCHRGVLLEVTYLPWSALADPDVVARTYYLAPSFARDTLVSDPDGRLRALLDHVRPVFARPEAVRDRCEDVLARMAAAPRPAASWAEAVTGWLFPTSLAAVVVLVAAGRNPTVRLRYPRAREVLVDHGLAEVYPRLLGPLGCADVSPALVRAHLVTMAAAFAAAAACGPTGFFFASDVSAAARPVAVDGAAVLVERGQHREAVFWLLATFSRAVQILAATGAADTGRHERAFVAAVSELVGLRAPGDLAERRALLLADLPWLRTLAATVTGRARRVSR